MTVRVHIERIVLEGVARGRDDAEAFRVAFERELARLTGGDRATRASVREDARAIASASEGGRPAAAKEGPERAALQAAARVHGATRAARS
jgi:hypothetical protein